MIHYILLLYFNRDKLKEMKYSTLSEIHMNWQWTTTIHSWDNYFDFCYQEIMTKRINCDFIEIGTSDFETEIQNANDNTIGFSIEPLPFYLGMYFQ